MRLYLYQLKNLLKTKDIMFWTMAFPIVLGTLFYVAFGRVEMDDQFSEIPVAYVWEDEKSAVTFRAVAEELDKEGELFDGQDMSHEDAKKELIDENIEAFFVIKSDSDVELFVKKSSISASIAETFLNNYLAQAQVYEKVAKESPEKLQAVLEESTSDVRLNDVSNSSEDYNILLNYFFSLIAMVCMFGGLLINKCIKELQADQSTLGARRSVAPTGKMAQFLADVMACNTIQMGEICITIIYLTGILKVNFGSNLGYVFLTALAGGLAGNSLGILMSLVGKGTPEFKEGMITCVSLVSSFLAGLMWQDMYRIVEKYAPIINRINPASLIVNSFYSLIIYDTKERYYQNILSLLTIFVVATTVSVVMIRRKKYASI